MLYSDRPSIYGAEQINHTLACALVKAGYQVSYVQPVAEHHLIREREHLGIEHHWLAPDDIYDLSRPARTLTDASEPEAILSATHPDLLLFCDSCPPANLKAKQVAGQLNIPYMVIVHCVNQVWAGDYADYLPQLPETYEQARAVIAVSQANLDLLRQCFGLASTAGEVIFYGRPHLFFAEPAPGMRQAVRQSLQVPETAVVAITVARLEQSKGYQHQLEALRLLQRCTLWPELHFWWVSGGGLQDKIQRMVRLLGAADQVHFLGERDDIPALLAAADVFVLPSLFEGMPLSIIEAMARGLPVVATPVSGTPEALGDTGHLLPSPDSGNRIVGAALAEVLCTWAGDANLRSRIGAAGQARARRLFREEQMIANYLRKVREALGRR